MAKFVKGQSGNPGGRKKTKVKILAEKNSPDAFNVIIKLATDEEQEPRVRLEAAKYIVDRAEGKPTQAISGLDEGPIKLEGMTDADLDSRITQLLEKAGIGPAS